MKSLLTFCLFFSAIALSQGQSSYTWFEGDTPRTVWLDTNWGARLEYPKNKNSAPRVTFVRLTRGAKNLEPVFRNSKTTGGRMVLPGNVVVRFKSEVTAEEVKKWVTSKNSEIVDKIKWEPNTYVITSIAGLATLELANRVRGDDEVIGAEPVWWTENVKK